MKTYATTLRAAARSLGIQASYTNNAGQTIWAPEKTLVQLCKNLGDIAPVDQFSAATVLKIKALQLVEKKLPTTLAAWNKQANRFHLQLNIGINNEDISFKINESRLQFRIVSQLVRKNRKTLLIQIETEIEFGYHDLHLFLNNKPVARCFLISAPEKLNTPSKRSWGPFLPLYALKSKNDWGIGSFAELRQAAELFKKYGADFISVLPLLAGRFEQPDYDPSPYSALTRFFWNEIYLDVDSLLKKYPLATALELRHSKSFLDSLTQLKQLEYVDYFACYQLKKKVLDLLAIDFFKKSPSAEYVRFLRDNPLAKQYAEFRSSEIVEQNYHLFVQFETDQALKEIVKQIGLKIYMDYPVGVNDSGFDFNHNTKYFLSTVSVGAPPEPVFQLGQDWGFPSFHPTQLAEQKYSYFIDSLRQHLKYSKILRLDHIIGLYRIYSVPKGYSGKNGAYLRFSKEDFFAILVLEATKFGADIIGENLGTVPDEVNKILERRNLKGMKILQLEMGLSPSDVLKKLNTQNLAALNTHDMPMFARFLKTEDLNEVLDLKILGAEFFHQLKMERQEQIKNWQKIFLKDPLFMAMSFLARSQCRYLILNIEDLWGEERPQNIPGTWKEVPNWRRKMKLSLEECESHPETLKILRLLKEHVC